MMDWQEKMADANERANDMLNDRVDELMMGDYNPFHPKNIIEAISEDCLFRNDDQFLMAELMETREMTQLGRFVYGRIIDYWERMALECAKEERAKGWGYGE